MLLSLLLVIPSLAATAAMKMMHHIDESHSSHTPLPAWIKRAMTSMSSLQTRVTSRSLWGNMKNLKVSDAVPETSVSDSRGVSTSQGRQTCSTLRRRAASANKCTHADHAPISALGLSDLTEERDLLLKSLGNQTCARVSANEDEVRIPIISLKFAQLD